MAKLGRNEPCHCGSGKKYKSCCISKDAEEQRKLASIGDLPLLVEGESNANCEEMTLHKGGKQISVVRKKIAPEDNHIHLLADGFDMQSCVMTRTDAGAEKYRKPDYAAKGFTWYIRLTPRCGGGIIAYFKDVEMALLAMESLESMEMESDQLPTNDDLVNIRRDLIAINPWHFLTEG